ncbi:transporter substrate-binding domain-containing protein [Pasteurellaceae bacterium USgator11]|nr:transporter substrate-binding domain-containing protein [Pasteurellaceae bacterium UScroc12]TNG96157.1 transporter substrate-binding domain-containing protein [Pasteurellaceae bacterium USgator41]TNG97973.1 transporter substrate-binding domain-containing protein [Pasteurellaceae bacterium UScroc31]TNH00168.1 transporter substrate-binding domain-containing protein [Pasteurellaceae bacterium USgator11]
MKKLLATALLATAFSANALDITFATEPTYPPFENTDSSGKIVGFDIDIANAICAEIKANCQFQSHAFDSLIPSLKFKRFDAAISAIDITAERAKQVSFSDPYYDSSASFIAVKGKADLNSAKSVGVQNGTTFQQYIAANGKQYNAKSYATLQSAILDLKNGRIDIIFGDTAVLADWMKTDDSLAFAGDKVTDPNYFGSGLGIAVNQSSTELLAELNKGLAAIKANGEYQKIYDTWMSGK